jgi:hypothetical protein
MSIFSKVAMPRPPSNTFDLSHDRKFSGRIGELMPIMVTECVPGDKFNIKTTNLTRFAPLITPIMHKASVYCHFFFVPTRILWPNWEKFISGGEDGLDTTVFPTMKPPSVTQSSLLDYLGLPDGNYSTTNVSAIPIAAYNKIYNDYYRDENLITTKLVDEVIDGDQATNPNWSFDIQKRAWQHDYYTSALPFTQRGPEATIPLGTTAPLLFGNYKVPNPGQTDARTLLKSSTTEAPLATTNNFRSDGDAYFYVTQSGNDAGANLDVTETHVADLSDATASSINDLRRAFRLQEWLERNARGGARYIEIIMAHFGVKSSDARLQRPEFLGGSSTPITISEVLQTSDNSSQTTPRS